MSDAQLMHLYMSVERENDGSPKLKIKDPPDESQKAVYTKYLLRIGIHDSESVDRLWKEHVAKLRLFEKQCAQRKKEKKRAGHNRGK